MKSAIAIAIGLVGLLTLGTSPAWVAGSLGVSASAASQIVSAIQAGGWALAIVMAIFGAGIIGAIIATVRGLILRKGRNFAIA